MNPQQTQTLLVFLMCFAFASAIGGLSYISAVLTEEGVQLFFCVAFAVFVFVPSATFFSVFALPVAGAAAVLCIVPAFLEKWREDDGSEWLKYFLVLWMATYQSVAVGWAIGLFTPVSEFLPSSIYFYSALPSFTFGLAFTPSSISFFRWTFHKSKLRPGIDRHLKEGEGTEQ